MADKIIDILMRIALDKKAQADVIAGTKSLTKALEDTKKRANETREQMEKLANVGSRMAMAGGAIIAPFALAMKKYLDATKESEPASKRILDAMKSFEQSAIRVGAVVADIVGPYIVKLADLAQNLAAFVEQNPGFVKVALGIGGALVAAGSLVSFVASIAGTLATIQGLATTLSPGMVASVAGGINLAVPLLAAAVGGMIGKAIGELILGREVTWGEILDTLKMLAVITAKAWDDLINYITFQTAKSNSAQTVRDFLFRPKPSARSTSAAAVTTEAAKAAEAGAQTYKATEQAAVTHAQTVAAIETQIFQQRTQIAANWALYENKTYSEIIQIERKSFAERLADWQRNQKAGLKSQTEWQKNLAQYQADFFRLMSAQADAFRNAIGQNIPGRAAGGYAGPGIYRLGERGREFVLNANSTRAAERMVGGRLTQANAVSAVTTNVNLSNGMTVAQARRMMQANNAVLVSSLVGA